MQSSLCLGQKHKLFYNKNGDLGTFKVCCFFVCCLLKCLLATNSLKKTNNILNFQLVVFDK